MFPVSGSSGRIRDGATGPSELQFELHTTFERASLYGADTVGFTAIYPLYNRQVGMVRESLEVEE